MAGKDQDRTIWLDAQQDRRYPGICPACLKAPADTPVKLISWVDGSSHAEWPHCIGCATGIEVRRQSKQLRFHFFLVGLVLFVVAVALLSADLEMPHSTLIKLGALGWGTLTACGVAVYGTRLGQFANPGVAFRKGWWPDNPSHLPLPGDPYLQCFACVHREYRNEFLRINPEVASSDLDLLRTKMEARSVAQDTAIPEEPFDNSELRQSELDSRSLSWQMSRIFALVVLVFSALPVGSIYLGDPTAKLKENAPWMVPLVCGSILAAIAFGLRMHVGRLLLSCVFVLLAASEGSKAWDHWLGREPQPNPWFTIGVFAVMCCTVWALNAGPARRLCSSWGMLDRWFGRG